MANTREIGGDQRKKSHPRQILRSNSFEIFLILFFFFQVTDTNDNPPVFPDNAYSFDVPENTVRGTRVGEIAAVDEDEGVNGQVTYQVISDWANDVFSLNPQSGVFTLTARLDYEEVSWSRYLKFQIKKKGKKMRENGKV